MLRQFRLGMMIAALSIGLLLITLLMPVVYSIENWHAWFMVIGFELFGVVLGLWQLDEVERFIDESDKTICRLQVRNNNQAEVIRNLLNDTDGSYRKNVIERQLSASGSTPSAEDIVLPLKYAEFTGCPDCGTDLAPGEECECCRARIWPGECQKCVENWRYQDSHWRNRDIPWPWPWRPPAPKPKGELYWDEKRGRLESSESEPCEPREDTVGSPALSNEGLRGIRDMLSPGIESLTIDMTIEGLFEKEDES